MDDTGLDPILEGVVDSRLRELTARQRLEAPSGLRDPTLAPVLSSWLVRPRHAPILIANNRGSFEARTHVTDDIFPGVVWMRDGWFGVNSVTSGVPIVSLTANGSVPGIPGRQAAYDAWVEVRRKEAAWGVV